VDTSRCETVSGRTEIEGTLQPFVGRACLQPNGVRVFVGENGSSVAPAYGYTSPPHGYTYYPYPWFWRPPFLIGSSVVFADHFPRCHHFHNFDHHFDHFHDRARIPFAGHPLGMHSWSGGHGRAGRMR
jgi:hypothetical protein